jgi:hypothetical protein
MATELRTFAAAGDDRTTGGTTGFTVNPTRQRVASRAPTVPPLMTLALSDIDRLKGSVDTDVEDDDCVHELNDTRLRSNNIRNGIPSLPGSWAKRFSALRDRQQLKAKPTITSRLKHNATRSVHANGGVVGQARQPASQPVPQPIAEELQMKVQVPLPMKERLKTWNLSSSLHLTADENATLDRADWEKLQHFIQFLDQSGSVLFHGLPSRNLCLTLVAISPDSTIEPSASSPYICIKGLMKETEITAFHTVLSQRSVRDHYKPLRICYDKSLVETAASDVTYQTNASKTQDTLCGTLLRTKRAGKPDCISTIGGIIKIDGNFFAVTTSHHPNDTTSILDEGISGSSSESPGSSAADTLRENGSFDADIDPALIIDAWKEQERQDHSVETLNAEPGLFSRPSTIASSNLWADLTTTVLEGSDWCLLAVNEELQLPNFIDIPVQQSGPSGEGGLPGGQGRVPAQYCSRKYLEAYPIELSRRTVYVFSSVSGICTGRLLGNISFLSLWGERSRIAWTVKVDTGFGTYPKQSDVINTDKLRTSKGRFGIMGDRYSEQQHTWLCGCNLSRFSLLNPVDGLL